VTIDTLQRWRAMEKHCAYDSDVAESVKNSTIVEVSPCLLKMRRKLENVNKTIEFLGFDKEGIRNLTASQFKDFIAVKEDIEN
jgi:hypothetical protein